VGELTEVRAPDASRSAGLDGLRAVASAMVVLLHLHAFAGVDFGPLNVVARGAGAGVWIFFALSGYLLYRPFLQGPVDLRTYALKRAARILPGYYVALFALGILTGNRLPLDHPIAYLTLTASYDIPLHGFLGVAWTLSAEILFYVALPVLALLVRRGGSWVLAVLGAGSLALAISHPADVTDPALWLSGTFPFVFYAFVPGMDVAHLQEDWPRAFWRLRRPAYFAMGVLYVIFGTVTGFVFGSVAVGIGSALLIAGLVQRPITRGATTLAFLGGASYALYLWHWDLLNRFGAAGLPIALAGSAISWWAIERPILGWAHRIARSWRRPPPPPDALVVAPSGAIGQ
jgi:peptidoglycan/LPS O-acetylase OafA/YrhL